MAARKRSSFGSVTRLERDVYRLRWWDDTPQGRRRCSETVHGTRRQADDRLAQIRLSVGSAPGGSVTLGQAYEKWFLPGLKDRVSSGDAAEQTLRLNVSVWEKHVESRWGSVPVSSIKPLDVQGWLSGLTSSTAASCRSLMRQTVSYCLKYGIVESNVMDVGYRMPKAGKKMDKGTYSLEQLKAVLEALNGHVIEAPFILAAFGSCRVGESLAVRPEDVGVVEVDGVEIATALIDKQVSNHTGEVVDRLKNSWSRRYVVVAGKAARRLVEIRDKCLGSGDAWLCDDGHGNPLNQKALARNWEKELKKAGFEKIGFRNLRNTWETIMHWDMGVEPAMIERMMGHVGAGVTARHYDRPDPMQFARALASAYKKRPCF